MATETQSLVEARRVRGQAIFQIGEQVNRVDGYTDVRYCQQCGKQEMR